MGFLLLTLAVLAADEPPENIANYFSHRDEQADAEIKRLDDEIRLLGKDKRKDSRQHVAECRKARDRLKKDTSGFVPQIPYKFCVLKAGEIGCLSRNPLGERGSAHPGPTLVVFQIIDEKNMIVEATWLFQNVRSISATEFREFTDKAEHQIWLRGFPTEKLANGSTTTIDGLVEVTGNTTYETVAGGTQTLLVIEPFDRAKLEPWQSQTKKKPKTP